MDCKKGKFEEQSDKEFEAEGLAKEIYGLILDDSQPWLHKGVGLGPAASSSADLLKEKNQSEKEKD